MPQSSIRESPAPAPSVEPLDTESLDAALDAILFAHPPPHVVAPAETGLCVPMPAEFPLLPEQRISGVSTFLELVLSADMGAMVEAWERARSARLAQVSVHLRKDPDHPVMISFVDARHRYGVYLGIISGARVALCAEDETPVLFRPRLWTMDRDEVGSARSVDPAVEQVLGWRADELIGRRVTELIHPDDQPLSFATWVAMLARPGCDQRALMRYRHRDGHHIWFEVTHRNLLKEPNNPRVFTQFFDVSERMEAVEQLRFSEEILRRLTETLPQGVAHIDLDRRIVYQNERLCDVLHLDHAATLDDLLLPVAIAQRGKIDAAVLAVLRDGQPLDLEMSLRRSDGVGSYSLAMRALKTGAGIVSGAVLSVMDVTERERLRAEVQHQARFDLLTRCLHRPAILEVLEDALARIDSGAGLAVFFIDLNGFKQINDEFGHAAGDALLGCVGKRLVHAMRGDDAVGRIGGDEFLVVCPGVDAASASAIATRLYHLVGEPTRFDVHVIVPGASIGVAWTSVAVDADSLIARADAAMYQAKRAKSGPVVCAGRAVLADPDVVAAP